MLWFVNQFVQINEYWRLVPAYKFVVASNSNKSGFRTDGKYIHVKRGEREGEESEVGRGGSSSNSVCLFT